MTKEELFEGEILMDKKCPCCGKKLIQTPLFNPEIFKNNKEAADANPQIEVCRNPKCHGWYCEYEEEWHPYGTSCSVASIRNMRSGTNYPEDYEDWVSRKNCDCNSPEKGKHKACLNCPAFKKEAK